MKKLSSNKLILASRATILCLSLFSVKAGAQELAKPFVVSESAFTVEYTSISSTGLWMWWTAVLKNPNPDYTCAHPQVTVTARNGKGEVVGTYDKSMVAFFVPGGVIAYGDNLEVLEVPAKIEITPVKCFWTKMPTASSALPTFQAANVKLIPTRNRMKVAGEVINPLPESVDSVMGALLFRDQAGKLFSGELFYIKNLPARGTKPFMEDLYFDGARPRNYDKVEFMVFPTSSMNYGSLLRP
jgi:hypothetical protein